MKHADVPAALGLVVEEVGKEFQRIQDAGIAEDLQPTDAIILFRRMP